MTIDYEVGIIGAGFAGLVAALRLKRDRQDSFVIFERAAEIGGTWRDNVYPGCACDIASPLYSFAHAPKLDWSHAYAPQPEILAYMQGVVDERNLRPHLRLNTDITRAHFEAGAWTVEDAEGNRTRVRALLLGLGPLNRVHVPAFAGLADFQGRWFHSAEWDPSYDYQGKRVAVIGTGASAIQIVPSLAPQVSELKVMQRTPAWVADRFDHPISETWQKRFERWPRLMWLYREAHFWFNEGMGLGFIGHRRVNRLLDRLARRKLAREVADPDTRRRLTPDYTIGCKRILRSDDYYPTFNQPHVHLISEGIERFEPQGIRTADGTLHELDLVVMATGFHVSDLAIPLTIEGLAKAPLFDALKQSGGDVYKGMTVPGFPNLAFILGPNTGLGHNSVVHMMESQMNYLTQYLQHLRSLPAGQGLDLKSAVLRGYSERLQQQFNGTVWTSGCQSWYLNADGKNNTLYPRLNTHFRRETRRFLPQEYRVVESERIKAK